MVRRAGRKVADELPVDLEIVERQVLQVVEGAKARPEVVECEAATDIGERGDEPPGLVHIADRGRLRDFEDQLRGVDRGKLELFHDEPGQLGIRDGPAGDVDFQTQLPPGAALSGDQLNRPAHDPAVDATDQIVALGGIEETRRE